MSIRIVFEFFKFFLCLTEYRLPCFLFQLFSPFHILWKNRLAHTIRIFPYLNILPFCFEFCSLQLGNNIRFLWVGFLPHRAIYNRGNSFCPSASLTCGSNQKGISSLFVKTHFADADFNNPRIFPLFVAKRSCLLLGIANRVKALATLRATINTIFSTDVCVAIRYNHLCYLFSMLRASALRITLGHILLP